MMTKRKVILWSTTTLYLAGCATLAAFIPQMVKNNVVGALTSELDESKEKDETFKDNRIEYKDKIIPVEDKEPSVGENLWSDIDENPYNHVYKESFATIDNAKVNSDIISWMWEMADAGNSTDLLVNVIQVDTSINNTVNNKAIGDNPIGTGIVNIGFQFYNDSDHTISIWLEGLDYYLRLEPYHVSTHEIKINTNILPSVTLVDRYYYLGYCFENAEWTVDGKVNELKHFSTNDYSLALNTKFVASDFDMSGVGYEDIKDLGTEKIKGLTADLIAQDFDSNTEEIIDMVIRNVDELQSILQKVVKNDKMSVFLADTKQEIENIIRDLLPEVDLPIATLLNFFIDLLNDKNIVDLIYEGSDTIKTLLSSFSVVLPPEYATIFEAKSREEVESMLNDLVLGGQFDAFLSPELKRIITELLTGGFYSTLVANLPKIIEEVQNTIGINFDKSPLLPVFAFLEVDGILDVNKPVLDFIVDIVKARNENGNFIRQIMHSFGMDTASIAEGTMIGQLVFENNNFTSNNLKKLIAVVANPRPSKNSKDVISYQDYWNNSISWSNGYTKKEYDPETQIVDVKNELSFTFKNEMWFYIKDIYPILPSNLEVDGTLIPIGLLRTLNLLPTAFGLFPGDSITVTSFLHGPLYYDVVKDEEDRDVLSWQATRSELINVKLPKSIKSMYENTSTFTRGEIVDLITGLAYHVYQRSSHYRQGASVLNENVIENYNPYMVYSKGISQKITDEEVLALTTEIENSMVNVTKKTGGEQDAFLETYSWKTTGWFGRTYTYEQTITRSDYDPHELDDLLVNAQVEGDLSLPVNVSFAVDWMLRDISIYGNAIPDVSLSSIQVWTTHAVPTGDGLQSIWNF